jgi:CPA2 family monovalent cation:H+ antiporter-2
LGFVLGGLAISPFTPGPRLSEPHSFEVFAEAGVVMLMFSIGAEFSVKELKEVKWVALAGAPLGILAIIGTAIAIGRIAGFSTPESATIGATVSAASTMVLARLLGDSGNLSTGFGRVMIGITLVEDLAVICMTVVLPVLASSGDGHFARVAWTLGKALILLVPLVLAAIQVIPKVLRRVKATCNSELFLLVAISVCFGTAALAQAVGFSTALGAFLAGLSVSGVEDLHDAHRQLVPLRDAFVALFFVSLGTLVNPAVLLHNLALLGTMLALIVLAKLLVWAAVVKLFRYPLKTAVIVAAGLTQIGELSFVVAQVARSSGLVPEDFFSATIAASLVSILLNAFIVRFVIARLTNESSVASSPEPAEKKPVLAVHAQETGCQGEA